jgi:DNA-binding transcriptional LysR family regulator
MDRLGAMAILLRVVQAGSLSEAARQLEMPLATVSRRLSELEAHLQAQVLNRSSRRLSLTDAGRLYIEACKRILDQVDEAERSIVGVYKEAKGRLTVTAPVVFGRMHMIPIAKQFLDAYPDIDLKLVLADRLLDMLETNIDVAVRIGALADSSMVATRVGAVRRVVCASTAYLERHGRPARPQDMQSHTCVTFDNLASPEAWRFVGAKSDIIVPIHSRLTVTTAEAALDAVIAGLGFSCLLSYQISESRRAGLIDVVLEEYERPAWPVSVLHLGQENPPKKLRAFLDFFTPRLRARLAEEDALFEIRTGTARGSLS